MPGKWVGGPASKACPSRGEVIEAKVFDDDGRDQGTVFIEVKRLYSPGEEGRSFLGDLETASDPYYRHWAKSKAGSPSTRDGLYHLCSGDPTVCPVGKGKEIIVHLGKWRNWPLDDLIRGDVKHLDREAMAGLSAYLKSSPVRKRDEGGGGLPWKGSGLSLGSSKPLPTGGKEKGKADPPRPKSPREAAEPPAKKKKSEKIKGLRQQLEALKRELAEEEARDSSRSKSMKKGAPRSAMKRARGDKRETAESRKKSRTGKEAEKSEEGDDDEEGEEEESGDSDEEIEPEDDKAKKKAIAAKAAKQRKKKEKKVKKKKKTKATKKVRDRGAFGVAPTEEYPEEAESDEETDSGEDSEKSFQKAPSSRSHRLKLVRYAKRHPGRLAARLLRRMESATGFGGGRNKVADSRRKAPSRGPHVLPRHHEPGHAEHVDAAHPERAEGSSGRPRAEDKSAREERGGREPMEESEIPGAGGAGRCIALVDQGEEDMMVKEAEREEKLKGGRPHWEEPWRKGKGKGAWSNDQRKGAQGGGKAKGKSGNPAEKLTGKKDDDK
eukprot:Skav209262  [mRNA]  locus=scaffold1552:47774:49938:+ [translate_table: standard]